MATLDTTPRSSTSAQHKVLVIEAKRRGIDLDSLRDMVGGSVRALSSAQASYWIRKISEKPLPHPPGKAPRTRLRAREGITRMISAEHIEQIERLGLSYFDGDSDKFGAWLRNYYSVDHPRMFATAAKAGQVITALKQMHTRRARTHAAIPTKETIV